VKKNTLIGYFSAAVLALLYKLKLKLTGFYCKAVLPYDMLATQYSQLLLNVKIQLMLLCTMNTVVTVIGFSFPS